MSNIENRIVQITFDNEQFEQNIAATLESLDRLSQSLQFVGAAEGLSELGSVADQVNFSGMETAIESISNKLSVMGVIGFEAIRRLTGAAIDFTKSIADKALGPLLGGGKLRAENLEQARFLFRGLGIDVEAGMASALAAVKGTAFGLDAAAKAAAQLAGSGLEAGDKMTGALRGIAGTAAQTNTSFEEMADVFTSAAGKGAVSGYELQRIGQRGLNAAASLAKVWGTTEQEVRRMASEGEISFEKFAEGMDAAFGEHATKANETYTGSLANMRAALSRIGASFFGPQMLQQRDLFNALTPVIDKVHDALKPLIQTFLDMRGVGVQNLISALNGLDLTNFTYGIQLIANGLRHAFAAFQQLITPLKEAFREIFPASSTSIIITIAAAFESLTEKLKMGEGTLERVKSVFRGVFAVLAIGMEVIRVVAGLFRDLFETFVAPKLGGAGGGILQFFANIGESLVRLKETLVDGGGIQKAVSDIVLWFTRLGDRVAPITAALGAFRDKLADMFGFDVSGAADGVSGGLDRVGDSVGLLGNLVDRLKERWEQLGNVFSAIMDILDPIIDAFVGWFSELGQKLAEVMAPSDFNAAVDIVNVGLLGGIAVMIKRFMDGGLSSLISGGTGIIETIKGTFDALTDTLSAMQAQLKSKALMNIAIAVGVLTASIVVLSLIDSAALAKALTAIAVSFGQLIGVMVLLEKFSTTMNPAKMGGIATGMILISTAVLILSLAVKTLSDLSLAELAKGLAGVAASMYILVAGVNLITTEEKAMIRAGLAMIAIGIALNILALAVKSFADLSWEEMAKGLIGVGVGLGIIVTGLNLIPEGKLLTASIGIAAIAVALNILALAVKSFAEMEWDEMGKGMAGIAGGLTIILIAMNLMPPGQVLAASVAMIAMGVALNVIAKAVESMGSIPFGELAKGLGAMAITLGLLVIAMNLMTGTAAGAAALLITAGALAILAGVLKTLGEMEIGEIGLALGALAGVLLVIGAAGYLIAPVVPALMAFGVALLFISGAVVLFGAGAMLVAKSFEIMAKAGEAGISVMMAAMLALAQAFPKFIEAIVMAIVEFVQELVEAAPTLLKAITVLISHILDTVITLVPQIVEALAVIITGFLLVVAEAVPQLIATGFTIINALLQGIRDNIFMIVTAGVEILTNLVAGLVTNMAVIVGAVVTLLTSFVGALTERAAEIVAAGLGLLTALIQGVTDNIAMVTTAVASLIIEFLAEITRSLMRIVAAGTEMLVQLLLGISDNLAKVTELVGLVIVRFIDDIGGLAGDIIEAGLGMLTDLLQGISDNIGDVIDTVEEIITTFITEVGAAAGRIATAGADALIDFLDGIQKDIGRVIEKGVEVIAKFIEGVGKNAVVLANAAADALIDFLNGLADAIETKTPLIMGAGARIARALIDGVVKGLTNGVREAANAAVNLAKSAWDAAMGFLGINSPSKKFIWLGEQMAAGMALSLNKDMTAKNSAVGLADRVVTGFQKTLEQIPDTLGTMNEFNPTITPVLDLTKVKMGAKSLDSLMSAGPIAPTVSFDRAQQISTTAEVAGTDDNPPVYAGPSEVTFEQNIYSPTALSTNDIYRNTRSQIALAKEELSI